MSDTIFYAIQEPGANEVNHTTLFLTPEDSIKEFLEQEQSINWIANAGRLGRGEDRRVTPSWEHYEAEGYRVRKCKLIVLPET